MKLYRTALFLLAALLSVQAWAQQATSDFWEDPLGPSDDAPAQPMPEPDEELFRRLLQPPIRIGINERSMTLSSNIITHLSEYNFAATRYTRRGEQWEPLRMHRLELTDAVSGREDYNVLAALRYFPGWRNGTILPSLSPEGGSVTMLATDRAGRLGFRAAAAGGLGEGWFYGVSAGRRWGRDAQIDGVFERAELLQQVYQRDLGAAAIEL